MHINDLGPGDGAAESPDSNVFEEFLSELGDSRTEAQSGDLAQRVDAAYAKLVEQYPEWPKRYGEDRLRLDITEHLSFHDDLNRRLKQIPGSFQRRQERAREGQEDPGD